MSDTVEDRITVLADLGNDMLVIWASFDDLREQDINAQVMPPAKFAQLVANIKERGQLEQLPYVSWPAQQGTPEIVSGHNRTRAGRAAGLPGTPCLADTRDFPRSIVRAKQLAHNALTGESDASVIRRMLEQIDDPDALISTGLDADLLPLPSTRDTTNLGTPTPAIEWRTMTVTFVPNQFTDWTRLLDELSGTQDQVGLAPIELFDPFVKATGRYGRIKDVRNHGTLIHTLTRVALRELEAYDQANEQGWVDISEVVGTSQLPAEVAMLLGQLVERLLASEDITEKAKWRALELAVVSLLNELP